LRLEAGDRIPADGVLREGQGIMVDESILTGESVPVDKERGGEAFSGTLLVRGKGSLEISRTGAASAMGKIAVMSGGIEAGKTPLEARLEAFGGQVAQAIFALAVVLALAGLYIEGLARLGHVLLFAVAPDNVAAERSHPQSPSAPHPRPRASRCSQRQARTSTSASRHRIPTHTTLRSTRTCFTSAIGPSPHTATALATPCAASGP
jgi:hypothetical protein